MFYGVWLMPLFFVHIPKTAGTSFRLGAELYFSKEKIVYDYTKNSNETSPVVFELLYEDLKDLWEFKNVCEQRNTAMIGGHVSIGRFVSLFGTNQTLTFLRDPLQRIASEYAHFVRHYEYTGSFQEFYSLPVMQNRQKAHLKGVALEAIGFVGLTENYAESLDILNAHYGIKIPLREDNRGKQNLSAIHEISFDDEVELKRLNKEDLHLYQQASKLFKQRLQLFQKSLCWVHARLIEVKPDYIAGWAWWADKSDKPVLIEIWVNGKHVRNVYAVDFRPGLAQLRVPRGAYVGFHLPMKLKSGDLVQCSVASTRQIFPLAPYQIP